MTYLPLSPVIAKNILPPISSASPFSLNDYYAHTNTSAEEILKKVNNCLSALDNNYQPLKVAKTDYYSYVKFHWDLSQTHWDNNQKTALLIQNACRDLILQGVAYKLFQNSFTIEFSDQESIELNASQAISMGLISPMIKASFDHGCIESHRNMLSLAMSKAMFFKIVEMAKEHVIPDLHSLNNILETYDNVNLLGIEHLKRELVNCILSLAKDLDLESQFIVYNYFFTRSTTDSQSVCNSLLLNIGEGLMAQFNWNKVNELILSAMQAQLDKSKIQFLKSCVHAAQYDLTSALCCINSAVDCDPNVPCYKIQRASINFRLSAFTEALKDLNPILNQQPHNLTALNLRGRVYMGLLKYNYALNDFNMVLNRDRYNIFALRNRFIAYQKQGEFEEAAKALNEVLLFEPYNVNAPVENDALPKEPKDADAYRIRGDIFWSQGNYEEAFKNYQAALQIEQNNILFLSRRGEACRMLGEQEAALNDFNQVLLMDPNNICALTGRGEIYSRVHPFGTDADFRDSQFDGALKDINKALKLQPDSPRILRIRAETYVRKASTNLNSSSGNALNDIDQSLQIEPGNARVKARRKQVLEFLRRETEVRFA